MESVHSFNAATLGKAYGVYIHDLHPDGDAMLFHIDSGASFTFLGLNCFCDEEDTSDYALLKSVIEDEITKGGYESVKHSASTATKEQVEMYPCKYDGVSVAGTLPITLYFCIYLGDIDMPLLGFDYIDDCSYHHTIGGELMINAVAQNVGKRFYPDDVIDFNRILDVYMNKKR